MFLSAFLAATILPFSSEIVLSALYGSGLNGAILLVVASIGNVLGSLVNYLLGYAFGKDIATQKLNISEATFNRASSVFTRWGKWSLVFMLGADHWRPYNTSRGRVEKPPVVFYACSHAKQNRTVCCAALCFVLRRGEHHFCTRRYSLYLFLFSPCFFSLAVFSGKLNTIA
ncbi:membrane hypothetical protein [Alteromonas infernus]